MRLPTASFPRRARTPRLALVLLVLALLAAAPLALAKGPRGGDRIQWWNDPALVEELGLSAEQREKMDAALALQKQALEKAKRRQDQHRKFNEALEAADWERARQALDTWVSDAGSTWAARGELKLTVLQLLTPEQHKILVERYPRMIRRPWDAGRHHQGRPGGREGGKPFRGGRHKGGPGGPGSDGPGDAGP